MLASVSPSGSEALTPETLQQIEESVRRELRGRRIALRLSIRDGMVVCQGLVHNYHAKQLVLHAIMKATYLPIQCSELEVR